MQDSCDSDEQPHSRGIFSLFKKNVEGNYPLMTSKQGLPYRQVKKERGRLRDMIEIYKMWRVCRLLRKNESIWYCARKTRETRSYLDGKDEYKHYHSEDLDKIVQGRVTYGIALDEDRLLAKRNTLVWAYITKYHKELKKKGSDNVIGLKDPLSKEVARTVSKVQSYINSCIDRGFIGEKNKMIYITGKGKLFADPTCVGLLKSWINEIGTLWKVIMLILTFLAGLNWSRISDIVQTFYEKISQ